MQENERLTITVPEFAKLTGISRNQAYTLAARDALGVAIIRLGKRMVLSRRAVMRLLDSGSGEGANGA